MDAIELVQQHCPAPIVAYAQQTDPSGAGIDFWPASLDLEVLQAARTPACLAAMVAFYAPGLTQDSQPSLIQLVFLYASQHGALLPPDHVEAIRQASRRIVPQDRVQARDYFAALHALDLDNRDVLDGKILPSLATHPAGQTPYYHYQVWLTRYGDADAIRWYDETLAGYSAAEDASAFLLDLPQDVPAALRPILRRYVDDARGIKSSAGFAAQSVGQIARQKLGETFATPLPRPKLR